MRLEREMSELQTEMARKEEQLVMFVHKTAAAASQASFTAPVGAPKRELSRPTETSVMSEKSMAFPGTPQGSASYPVAAGPGSATREDSLGLHSRPVIGRQASDSITRQLFTQQTVSEHPAPLSARGMNRHTSEPLQALQSLTTSSAPTVMASQHMSGPVGSMRLISAQPPRPSPRGTTHSATSLATSTPVQPWRSHSQGAPVAASPRGAKAIAAHQGLGNQSAAVRAMVTKIEQRSVSQTRADMRTAEGGAITPSRPVAMATATTRAASASAPSHSISARAPLGSAPSVALTATAKPRGEVLMRGRSCRDEEAPYSSPLGSEDNISGPICFGMSPMGRPRGATQRTEMRTAMGSPSPKPTSVQDRIRQFQKIY